MTEQITLPRAVVQQALEALAGYRRELNEQQPCDAEIALRALLCAAWSPAEPVQQPYAWHYTNNAGASVWHRGPSNRLDADMQAARDYPHVHKITTLYTAPQQVEPERNFCSRCGKRLADEGIHTCTPPQTKCSHCASPLFAAIQCRVCGRKPEWVCPESGEKTYDRPGHCDDCGLTLVRKETK